MRSPHLPLRAGEPLNTDSGRTATPRAVPPALAYVALMVALAIFAYQGLIDRETGGLNAVQDHVITWSLSDQAVRQGSYFEEFAYPPPALVFKLVFGLPGMAISSVAWMVVLLVSCFVVARGLAEVLGRGTGRPSRLAPVIGFAVAIYAVQWDLRAVNSNMVFLALVVGSLVAHCRQRDAWAGLLLAGSIALKLYSVVLIPLLWLAGGRRALLWAALSLLFFFGALPVLYLGPSLALDLTGQWLGIVMRGSDPDFILGLRAYKVSFAYVMLAYLSDAPAAASTALVSWPVEAVHWVTRVLQLAWLGAMSVHVIRSRRTTARAPGAAADGPGLLADVSLLLLTALVLSPITQPHQCVVLILPAAVLADRALSLDSPSRTRTALFALLAVAGLGPLLMPSGPAKGLALNGVVLGLSIALIWISRKPDPRRG